MQYGLRTQVRIHISISLLMHSGGLFIHHHHHHHHHKSFIDASQKPSNKKPRSRKNQLQQLPSSPVVTTSHSKDRHTDTVIMHFRLRATRECLCCPLHSAQLLATRKVALARFASSSATKPTVNIEQTKKSNIPDEEPTPNHIKWGTITWLVEP